MRKQKVLFLCTQNSARSQMAEGFLRHLAGDSFEVHSAGYKVDTEIHPYAVEVMEEVGIDISDHYPKGLKTYMGKMGLNYSIIVCARAEQDCPKTFPGVGTRLVWAFADPRGEDVPEEEQLEKHRAGVWERLHRALLDRQGEAGRIDWSRASLDSASVAAPGGARRRARTRQIAANRARSATSW